jgi:hypothetical protein
MPQIYLRTDLYEEIVLRGHRGEAVGEFVNKAVAKALVNEERNDAVRKGFEMKEEEESKSEEK